jgi:hypothetical protein
MDCCFTGGRRVVGAAPLNFNSLSVVKFSGGPLPIPRIAKIKQTVWKHCLQRRRLINQLQLLCEFSER